MLKASNAGAADWFGRAVALDGDELAVGAAGEDANGTSGDDNSLEDSGAVYLFSSDDADAWAQTAYLKASNADVEDLFGMAVSLRGDTLAVGAGYEDGDGSAADDNSAEDAGAVYVFARSVTWAEVGYLKAAHADSGIGDPLASRDDVSDYFGQTLTLASDTELVIGAPSEDSDGSSEADDNAAGSGAVYVFQRL